MRGWVLKKVGHFEFEDVKLSPLRDREVLVKVRAAGVCGSDIPRIYELGTRVPSIVLGHEFAGEIVEVSKPDDSGLIGRRAAVFPLIPCSNCEACLHGRYAQCQSYSYLGSRQNGGFAEYCVVPSRWHLLLGSDETSFEELAMIEPASVARHAVQCGHIHQGDRVVILGAGTIGIIVARWIALTGATPVLVDIEPGKLEFVNALGMTAVMGGEGSVDRVQEVLGDADADVVIEGTGAGSSLAAAAQLTKAQGTIVLLGNPHRDTTIPLKSHSEIMRRELRVRGVWNSEYLGELDSDWTRTLAAIESGELQVADLVSHVTELSGLGALVEKAWRREIAPWKMMFVSHA